MGGTFKTNARKIKGFNSTDLTAEEIEDLMIKYAMTHYVDLKVCSQELLKKWHEMGLVLGIISGNTKEVIEQVLNNDLNNEVDFFEPIYETNSGRSKAGCLIDFTNRFKLSNDEVVYIGDHTNDIVAAKEAGVGSIAVLSGLLKREDFRGCDPDLIVDNIGNLDEFILLDEKH
jgi:HAD superfamily hydrolase (TIGR01549 family)